MADIFCDQCRSGLPDATVYGTPKPRTCPLCGNPYDQHFKMRDEETGMYCSRSEVMCIACAAVTGICQLCGKPRDRREDAPGA